MQFKSLILAIALMLTLVPAAAAAQAGTSAISGIVKDVQGAPIRGAQVTIVNEDTRIRIETVTNDDGAYRAAALVPGSYRQASSPLPEVRSRSSTIRSRTAMAPRRTRATTSATLAATSRVTTFAEPSGARKQGSRRHAAAPPVSAVQQRDAHQPVDREVQLPYGVRPRAEAFSPAVSRCWRTTRDRGSATTSRRRTSAAASSVTWMPTVASSIPARASADHHRLLRAKFLSVGKRASAARRRGRHVLRRYLKRSGTRNAFATPVTSHDR